MKHTTPARFPPLIRNSNLAPHSLCDPRRPIISFHARIGDDHWPEWPIAALTIDNVNIDVDGSGNADISAAAAMKLWGALFLLRTLLFAAVLSSLVSAG